MNYIHKLFLHITVFQGIVEFIYHGEVSVFQESLTSFLRTAQILKVKGNYQRLHKRLSQSILSSIEPNAI